MKKYWILWVALILATIGLVLELTLGNVFNGGQFARGYFAAGDFAIGVFAAGHFSIGIFSAGLFSIGIFSISVFNMGLYAVGFFVWGWKTRKHGISSDEVNKN